MDTVMVTGGLGRSGRWIVDRLAKEHFVWCVDLTHPGFEVSPADSIDFRAADLTDRGRAYDLVGELEPDHVVHWAAHPSPTRHSGGEVYETNTIAAYNVLTAAGRAGANIVNASSESVYGYAFGRDGEHPDRVPIVESEPNRPEDPYGTGKVVAEEIASMVARKHGVSAVSIRPSWIQYPGEYHCREPEQLADVSSGDGNFWAYIDVRDVADLVSTAVNNPLPSGTHEAVHAMAVENYFDRPTVDLFEACFGSVPETIDLNDDESAFSMQKAEALFGWQPSHSWQTAATEHVDEPVLYET
ncbi:NAD-dependent epimerase/dehydratase family protein [Halalkalirubrum salinum]|uniref:NAD-dependent epimerase/dehydratase family protein n=1 Tax=Halalkalirubrum salinum TaxID=2563889 RepID=UPI0010FB976F|nr:NAD(P)-dependent oxidoreductase [Halalkalirubrum salinum]